MPAPLAWEFDATKRPIENGAKTWCDLITTLSTDGEREFHRGYLLSRYQGFSGDHELRHRHLDVRELQIKNANSSIKGRSGYVLAYVVYNTRLTYWRKRGKKTVNVLPTLL